MNFKKITPCCLFCLFSLLDCATTDDQSHQTVMLNTQASAPVGDRRTNVQELVMNTNSKRNQALQGQLADGLYYYNLATKSERHINKTQLELAQNHLLSALESAIALDATADIPADVYQILGNIYLIKAEQDDICSRPWQLRLEYQSFRYSSCGEIALTLLDKAMNLQELSTLQKNHLLAKAKLRIATGMFIVCTQEKDDIDIFKLDDVEAVLESAIALDATLANAYLLLGSLHEMKGSLGRSCFFSGYSFPFSLLDGCVAVAIQAYEQAMTLDATLVPIIRPKLNNLYLTAGRMCYKSSTDANDSIDEESLDTAEFCFIKSIEFDRSSALPYYFLGLVYQKRVLNKIVSHHYSEVIKLFNERIRYSLPKDVPYDIYYIKDEQRQIALKLLYKTLSLDEGVDDNRKAQIYFTLGVLYADYVINNGAEYKGVIWAQDMQNVLGWAENEFHHCYYETYDDQYKQQGNRYLAYGYLSIAKVYQKLGQDYSFKDAVEKAFELDPSLKR